MTSVRIRQIWWRKREARSLQLIYAYEAIFNSELVETLTESQH